VKSKFAVLVSLIAIAAATPATAQDLHACIDEACTLESILPQDAASGTPAADAAAATAAGASTLPAWTRA
jgi:putative endopeptidase